MAQYACMHALGWVKHNQIKEYFKDGSELKGLSDSRISGLEVTSGSLGHGFSIGVGLALGIKQMNTDQKVYALVGDGELNEGAIWEGAMFAAQNKLNNLMMIVDLNGFQAMGRTSEIICLGNLQLKLESFGFTARQIDGHDEEVIKQTIQQLWNTNDGKPKAIIAKTVKGKGVSFMEDDNNWHYRTPNENELEAALKELEETNK